MAFQTKEDMIPTSQPLLPRINEDPGALIASRAQAAINQMSGVRRFEAQRRSNRLLTVGVAGMLACVAAIETIAYFRSTPERTIVEYVQPSDYQNPSLLVQRAEKRFGSDPGEFNLHEEASRIAGEYGQLQVGEKVEVNVK